jgi:hypothetical protein
MSPQRHRELNAKVGGRDRPEGAKKTMGTFRRLMGRLLTVTPVEIAEQERLFEEARRRRFEDAAPGIETANKAKKKKRGSITAPLPDNGSDGMLSKKI